MQGVKYEKKIDGKIYKIIKLNDKIIKYFIFTIRNTDMKLFLFCYYISLSFYQNLLI